MMNLVVVLFLIVGDSLKRYTCHALTNIPSHCKIIRKNNDCRQVSKLFAAETDSYSSESNVMIENNNNVPLTTIDDIFDHLDVDKSGSIDYDEFSGFLTSVGYGRGVIDSLYEKMAPHGKEITRNDFHGLLVEYKGRDELREEDADLIFQLVDTDGSGTISLEELTTHLVAKGYDATEVAELFRRIDTDQNQEICRDEFRRAMLCQEDDPLLSENNPPKGYFLDSVQQAFVPLGPIGRLSQKVETSGPFKRIYENISNLFGIDSKQISKLGVSFALSYSLMSNLNGAISLSVSWYMACKRTGMSPIYNWKSLLTSYGMIYSVITLLRPFRVAAAIGMSKLSAEYLELLQTKLQCNRNVAIAIQYLMGW
eukprot:CAMPEP_0178903740 /NCGR_PEP_ID=MMETSP0786-20121207/5319_1 /TAXON_ID=186022 /ORGANISM="Thalassionema frauenfeldii, Strain CCMP 1798" /LENGTH=367 /DNA_ID=CAMNT_0020575133 /DNA_START=35 /DNA_END=1135 /DNA_ORIENTATION=-